MYQSHITDGVDAYRQGCVAGGTASMALANRQALELEIFRPGTRLGNIKSTHDTKFKFTTGMTV